MEKKYWSSRIHTLVPYVPGEHPRGQTFIKLNTNIAHFSHLVNKKIDKCIFIW